MSPLHTPPSRCVPESSECRPLITWSRSAGPATCSAAKSECDDPLQTQSTGLPHPSLKEGAGKGCSVCPALAKCTAVVREDLPPPTCPTLATCTTAMREGDDPLVQLSPNVQQSCVKAMTRLSSSRHVYHTERRWTTKGELKRDFRAVHLHLPEVSSGQHAVSENHNVLVRRWSRWSKGHKEHAGRQVVSLVVMSGHWLVALSLAISVKPVLNCANVSSRT